LVGDDADLERQRVATVHARRRGIAFDLLGAIVGELKAVAWQSPALGAFGPVLLRNRVRPGGLGHGESIESESNQSDKDEYADDDKDLFEGGQIHLQNGAEARVSSMPVSRI
jgi:hypothetical protein